MTERKRITDPQSARLLGRVAQLKGKHELRDGIDPSVLSSYEEGVRDIVNTPESPNNHLDRTHRVEIDSPRPSFFDRQRENEAQTRNVGEQMFDSMRRQRGD